MTDLTAKSIQTDFGLSKKHIHNVMFSSEATAY